MRPRSSGWTVTPWARAPAGHRATSRPARPVRPARLGQPGQARRPARPSAAGGPAARDRPRPASRRPAGPPPRRTTAAPRRRQRSKASGQRGWNRHPSGIAAAFGVSPLRMTRAARVASSHRVGRRRDADERARVGMVRVLDDLLGRSDLHDPTEVHDRDPVGDDPGERQVVGDEQVRQPALLAQVEHQPQELRPDRDVEHRHGLVGDDELGSHRQGTGDDDPLALAAGQLVRVAERVVARPVEDRRPRAPA